MFHQISKIWQVISKTVPESVLWLRLKSICPDNFLHLAFSSFFLQNMVSARVISKNCSCISAVTPSQNYLSGIFFCIWPLTVFCHTSSLHMPVYHHNFCRFSRKKRCSQPYNSTTDKAFWRSLKWMVLSYILYCEHITDKVSLCVGCMVSSMELGAVVWCRIVS